MMTLEQVRDEIRNMGGKPGNCYNRWADAIDAHIAGMSVPVAWQYRRVEAGRLFSDWHGMTSRQYDAFRDSPHSNCEIRKLYTAPPASGDWDAVRGVRDALRAGFWDSASMADKLTAALPESQP